MEVLVDGSQGEPTSLPKSVPVASIFSVLTLQGDKDDKRGWGNIEDLRLQYFKNCWFEDKEVLDIGCNIGKVIPT